MYDIKEVAYEDMPTCPDTRDCCFRESDRCKILVELPRIDNKVTDKPFYTEDGECPFAKKEINDYSYNYAAKIDR